MLPFEKIANESIPLSTSVASFDEPQIPDVFVVFSETLRKFWRRGRQSLRHYRSDVFPMHDGEWNRPERFRRAFRLHETSVAQPGRGPPGSLPVLNTPEQARVFVEFWDFQE